MKCAWLRFLEPLLIVPMVCLLIVAYIYAGIDYLWDAIGMN